MQSFKKVLINSAVFLRYERLVFHSDQENIARSTNFIQIKEKFDCYLKIT